MGDTISRPVYSVEGQEVRTIELDRAVFDAPANEAVIWYAINNELANKRLGTACTKDRGEVHGSNEKPYKQKGTGRARRGDKKSPLLVGGGTVFGPKPRDFSFSLPKKVKRLAIKTILSLKVRNDAVKFVEDFSVDSGKTKDLARILGKFGDERRTVLVLRDDDPEDEALKGRIRMLKRAGANIPGLSFLSYNRLRAHDLFYGRRVLILESAAKKLNGFYGESAAAADAAEEEGANEAV